MRALVSSGALALFFLLTACGDASNPEGTGTRAAVRVRVQRLETRRFSRVIERSGTLRSRVDLQLVAESPGQVVERVAKEGQRIDLGAPILHLRRELEQKRLAAASSRLARLRAEGAHPADTMAVEAEAAAAREALRQRSVLAPREAFLDVYHVELGSWVTPGQPVARLVDPRALYVTVSVLEDQILQLEDAATIRLFRPGTPERSFEGTLVRRGLAARPGTGIFDVEIDLQDPEALRPGFQVVARLPLGDGAEHLLLPREALFERHERQKVFVAVPNGDGWVARERDVRTEALAGDRAWLIVTEGAAAGDRVIVRGRLGLRDGDPLEIESP